MHLSAADTIATEIENLIVTGAFADGERLNEVALAARFGVSRTPVREAFQKLSTGGIVEQIPRRGVFVRHPGPVELLEMFEVMAELEAACGRLAARRIDEPALAELAAANAKCAAATQAGQTDDYYRENEIFHHLIYRESGNGFLAQEAARLHKRLKPFRRLQLQVRGRMPQSLDEHGAIIAALAAGEAQRAGDALLSHVAVQGEKFHHLVAALRVTA